MKTFISAVTIILLSVLLIPGNVIGQQPDDKIKIIFDCDLGDDIDDAYALALLLSSPEFEVLGLVMDYGNTPERARMALKVLHNTGFDEIPVVIGRKTNDGFSPQFNWSKGFEMKRLSKLSAVQFFSSIFTKYPNQVILLTTGPVSNMHDLLSKNPDILKKAKHIYSMFGSFYMGYGKSLQPSQEWNVKADLEASKAFVDAAKNITYVPLDVTTFVKLNEENRQLLLMRQTPLTNFLSGVYPLWRFMSYASKDPVLYDAVTLGIILWPELFTTRSAFVKIAGNGFTVIDESKEPNGQVAISINNQEFIKRMMERLLKQNLHFEK